MRVEFEIISAKCPLGRELLLPDGKRPPPRVALRGVCNEGERLPASFHEVQRDAFPREGSLPCREDDGRGSIAVFSIGTSIREA